MPEQINFKQQIAIAKTYLQTLRDANSNNFTWPTKANCCIHTSLHIEEAPMIAVNKSLLSVFFCFFFTWS